MIMGLMCANRDCYREVSEEALRQLPGIKCPHCGQRILFKKRPQVIKRVKAL
jgi:DNA-directed RNA polymerase subunit RPC12/RpoP